MESDQLGFLMVVSMVLSQCNVEDMVTADDSDKHCHCSHGQQGNAYLLAQGKNSADSLPE